MTNQTKMRACVAVLLLTSTGAAAGVNQLPPANWLTPPRAQPVAPTRAFAAVASPQPARPLQFGGSGLTSFASPQFRQQQQYLNLLLQGQQRLIWAQQQARARYSWDQFALGQVNALLRLNPLGRNTAALLALSRTLTQRLDAIGRALTANSAYMRLGLKNEAAVLTMMTKEAPLAPELRFYRYQVQQQSQLVGFVSRGFGSPTRPLNP